MIWSNLQLPEIQFWSQFAEQLKSDFDIKIRGGFVEHISWAWLAQKIVIRIIVMGVMSSVTPKAAAKHSLLFKEPASEMGLLNI